MTGGTDPALTKAQSVVLAAWPRFQAEAGILSWSLERMIRAMYRVDSLAELADGDALDLADLLLTAAARSAGPGPAPATQSCSGVGMIWPCQIPRCDKDPRSIHKISASARGPPGGEWPAQRPLPFVLRFSCPAGPPYGGAASSLPSSTNEK